MPFSQRLKQSRLAADITQAELAKGISVNQSTVAYWERGSSRPDAYKAQKLSKFLGVDPAWLFFGDKNEGDNPAAPRNNKKNPKASLPLASASMAFAKNLPVMGFAQAGKHGAMILGDRPAALAERPPQLAGNDSAFAVWVSGKSMEPRFRPGEMLYINPAKPVCEFCFVLIELKDSSAFIKEYIGQHKNKIILRQYNPFKELEIGLNEVKNMYRVVGSMES